LYELLLGASESRKGDDGERRNEQPQESLARTETMLRERVDSLP